jgi:hypothetical protein
LRIALTCVIAEGIHAWYEGGQEGNNPPPPSKTIGAISFVLSIVSLLASVVVVILVYKQYNNLRIGVKIAAWYKTKIAAQQSWSYSEFMTVFLIVSALVHGVKALSAMLLSTSRSIALSADSVSSLESLLGHKSRRLLGLM